ncbi:MAG: branched-chain amino acid ABC transporter substrate-binding protein [Actinomycetota bacterium]|nr:branched-chain amino acid ABC transporter substrate-binding protein [Actinomycetota bacterium]
MKRSIFFRLVATLFAFSLVAAACGGDDEGDGDGDGGPAAKDCTWVIGTIGALSGDFASIGQPIFNGIEFAINEINEQGDLACELELQSEDSQGNPEQAPQLAQSLTENEELAGIVGPYFSGETLATGDIYDQAGIAFLCPSCTNETIDDQGWGTFFRAVADDEVQGEQAGVYIAEALGAETTAIVHDNQDYSKGLAERVAEQLGDAATQPIIISPEETDYSSAVAEVKDSGADVVFYGGYVPQAGPLAKQLKEGGVDAQFVSDDGTKDNQFGELAGSAAEGAQVTCPCADPGEVEGGAEFVSGMEEEYGEPPGTFAAEAYDSVYLFAEALKDFDGDSAIEEVRQGIVDFLDSVEGFEGVVKAYSFNDQGNVEVGPEGIYVYEWDTKEGDFVILGAVDELVS